MISCSECNQEKQNTGQKALKLCLHLPVCSYITTVPRSEHHHISEQRDTVVKTRQCRFKNTEISDQTQQELLSQCPEIFCAAHAIQAMMQKHNTRCQYGNVHKKQTYRTLSTTTTFISMQTCFRSNLVPAPCGSVSTLFSLFDSEFMDLDSADICFREEKENWFIKFPMAEKQNQECLYEN